jgi:Holliday junction resolvase-like predicted endonuclease
MIFEGNIILFLEIKTVAQKWLAIGQIHKLQKKKQSKIKHSKLNIGI